MEKDKNTIFILIIFLVQFYYLMEDRERKKNIFLKLLKILSMNDDKLIDFK